MLIRLDKLLAHSGYGSRKEVKNYIRKGLIEVNGKVIYDDDLKIDTLVDEVIVGDEEVNYDEHIYIMLNKPEGYVSATVDNKYPTVIDLLKENQTRGLFPVGRLDIDTTGLLILSNDGALAHRLLSPKHHVEKEYTLTYSGTLATDACRRFHEGIDIEGEYITKPAELILKENHQANVILTEGKYHQVKRMIQAVGGEVTTLKRIRFKNIWLDSDLAEGEYRYLTEAEISSLKGVDVNE